MISKKYINKNDSNRMSFSKLRYDFPLITAKVRKIGLAEDVLLLVNKLNDKAFLYKDGKVDIIKNGKVIVRKFPSEKAASFYLLKTGWKYV